MSSDQQDQQWARVKALLARVGVDADTAMVGNNIPLRAELDWLDMRYTRLGKPATVKQIQGCIGNAIEQIDALRETFGPERLETFYAGDSRSFESGWSEAAELRGLLDKLEANLRSAKFDEQPKGNAHKAENEYWIALAKLWQRMVPQTTNKDVVTFVEIVTGAKPETIRSYLHRSGGRDEWRVGRWLSPPVSAS